MFCILLSTFAFVLETLPSLEGHWSFVAIEYFVSLFFTVEYGAKILTCKNMWKFFWNYMNMIDFFAIIPFWISLTFSSKDSTLPLTQKLCFSFVRRAFESHSSSQVDAAAEAPEKSAV